MSTGPPAEPPPTAPGGVRGLLRRRRLWLAAAALAGAACVAVVNAGTEQRPRPQAATAIQVRSASGPAGVVLLRDGTVIRMDQQSPPGRLVLPPPQEGPAPDGLAVGLTRVWVSYDGLVRGYGEGARTVRVFRVAEAGPLLMAEAGRVLWAVQPGGRVLSSARLARRPVRLDTVTLPAGVVGLTATGRGAWAVGADGDEATLLMRVPRDGRGGARTVARLAGAPKAIAAGRVTVWVLTTQGVFSLDHRGTVVRGPVRVPAGADEIAAGPGRVLVTAPRTGQVLERTLTGRRAVHDVGRGVRGVAAGSDGYWVSVGDRATPRMFTYSVESD